MYSKQVLKILENPQNAGRISKPDGIADAYNEDKTAHVEFSLRVESGIITNCNFRAQANPYIIAICSTITQMVKGKMVGMLFLDPYNIKTTLGDESPIDITFCIDCLRDAVLDYKEKLEKNNKE
ncbi:MAG: iron-sulfur cluster assembly scaffold protein [Clostridiales bacterium]|nr:iron-sulfur cluster assembly scaffold protein [Clostridiales bacterium]